MPKKKRYVMLSPVKQMEAFTDRTEMLIGSGAMDRLRSSHIAVFGLGGVGSYAAEALARSGVGELTLVDRDRIDISNINRQLYALHSTVGEWKTELAKERVLNINPDCRVHTICDFYLPETREKFFDTSYTYICDAIDTVTAKIDLIVAAKEKGIPLISCMGTGNKLHPERLEIADIYQTHTCPLARVLRRELKKRGIERQTVVFSSEKPFTAQEAGLDPETQKPIPASMIFVPAAAGLLMASQIVQDIIF